MRSSSDIDPISSDIVVSRRESSVTIVDGAPGVKAVEPVSHVFW
jgi:hypothetical protein